jgi:NADH-quinone oxidoreductase subunit L
MRAVYALLWNRYWVDEIYDALFIRPYVAFSRFFWKVVDSMLIDGIVNGVGWTVATTGQVSRRIQSGNVQHYALATVLGAVLTVGVYWWIG